MILIYFLFITLTSAKVYLEYGLSSGILKNDKFYVFSPMEDNRTISQIDIYDLKDGPISGIIKTQVNITNAPLGYMAHFLNISQDIQNGISDKIWLLEGYIPDFVTNNELDESKWMAQYVNDKQLNFGSSFIKLPNYTNFPKGGYSQNIINVNNNHVMYIIGGYAYSNQLNSTILTSCVFKYNFNSNIWSDLSENSKAILPPIAIHSTVQVNGTLFILNGYSPDVTDTNYPQTYSLNDPIKESPINKMYKFDLLTEKWSVVNIKTNLDSAKYGDGSMRGASYDYYNGNIISYGALKLLNSNSREPHFCTLDLATMEWHQNQIDTDTGLSNTLRLSFHQTLIIKDQLILFQSYTNQKYALGPYIINLKDFKFQSVLDYSGNINPSQGPSKYTIIIIALSSLVAIILLISFIIFIIRYRKNKLRLRNNKQVKPLWAVPAKGSYRYLTGSEAFDHSQTGEIFSLENADNLDCPIARSSFVQEDLNYLTLVRHGFDQNTSSNNITKIDP